jgi:hypothetical protein
VPRYRRQIFLSLLDLELHSPVVKALRTPADLQALYERRHREIVGMDAVPGMANACVDVCVRAADLGRAMARHGAAGLVLSHLPGLRCRLLWIPMVRSVRMRRLCEVRARRDVCVCVWMCEHRCSRKSWPPWLGLGMGSFEAAPGGCWDAPTGLRYRRALLEPGATRDGLAMLHAFLGRDPRPDAFLRMIGAAAAHV